MEVGGMNLMYTVIKREASGLAHALWAASHVQRRNLRARGSEGVYGVL